MKTHKKCLSCFQRQANQVTLLSGCSKVDQITVDNAISSLVTEFDMQKSPPENALPVYSTIAAITGENDPYIKLKKDSNEQALKLRPMLREEVQKSKDPLLTAMRFAIAGNIIDYGTFTSPDFDAALKRCRSSVPVVDDTTLFFSYVKELQKGARVLYLADNCGEIVYDSLLVECLYEYGFDITVVVKEGPIINDALLEDAFTAGLDKFARIMTNGTRCPGTVLSLCSPTFQRHFEDADLIISKGQGNFESLSEVDKEIVFLLTVKCAVAAKHLAELSGTDFERLPGKGEMAVYCSKK
jgi:uncharacterized protein with ATP-grasp and redox domains